MSRQARFIFFFLLGLLYFLVHLLSATTAPAQMIGFDSRDYSATVGDPFIVSLQIDPAGSEVAGLSLEVGFDSTLVELSRVNPGSWVTDAGLLYFFYDYTQVPPNPASSILFDLVFPGGARSEPGELVVCDFIALAEGVTALEFLTVDVRGPGNEVLEFSHSTGDAITVQPASWVRDAGFGQIKLLY